MWTSSRRLAAALAVALGTALACTEDDPAQPVDPPVTFSMNQVAGNGVTGNATIQDQPGDVSTVIVTLAGLPANGQHAGHVHRGSCASQGAILFGLRPILADSQGNGSATTTEVPDDLLGQGFYLQYHVALEPPGDPISCADIPTPPPPADTTGSGIEY